MNEKHGMKLSSSKEIAYIAVMVALLIGGQLIFSMVVGVEIVTLLIVSFSYVFGARRGMICAVAFALLRNFTVAFSPVVLILYLIYFPLLAAVFGRLGHIKEDTFKNFPVWFAAIVNIILVGIAAACLSAYLLNLIILDRFTKAAMYILLLVIFIISAALCLSFNVLFLLKKAFHKNTETMLKVIMFASIAATFTILFTLIDDVLTPLYLGSTPKAALSYFYVSFTAMLPQTVCTFVTVSTLFLPLTTAIKRATKL